MKTRCLILAAATTAALMLGGCGMTQSPLITLREGADEADQITRQWAEDMEEGMRQFRIDVDKAVFGDY